MPTDWLINTESAEAVTDTDIVSESDTPTYQFNEYYNGYDRTSHEIRYVIETILISV